MAKLILHVGPGKCGSSSIQAFFSSHEKPCQQSTHYVLLDPMEISALNCKVPDESLLETFIQQLSVYYSSADIVILSHEYLFQSPYSIRNLCCAAKEFITDILIVGYSRRQSDFLVSAYSQWWFRSPKRVHETARALEKLTLDPMLFTGLERQMIASISNDFFSARQLCGYSILDWNRSYRKINQLTCDEHGAVIKCGVLPNKQSNASLIKDFCEKSGLALNPNIKDETNKISNSSFNPDVIEAINNAVFFGLETPSPHQSNRLISHLSSQISQSTEESSIFLNQLKLYVDSYYFKSNEQLCQRYKLDEAYFSVSQNLSKPEILEIIDLEGKQRALNKSFILKRSRMLSASIAELCLKLAKRH